MRFDTWLEEISGTPLYLLVAFLILLLILHAALVWWRNLGDIGWKRVDYAWLGAAALGLFALTSPQAERFLSGRYAETEGPVVVSTYRFLRELVRSSATDGPCQPHARSRGSPAEFDQIEAARAPVCAQFRRLNEQMPAAVEQPYPALDSLGFDEVEGQAELVGFYITDVNEAARRYRNQRSRWLSLVETARRSGAEEVFIAAGPLLIALALALRTTKVSGEIKNARAKAAVQDS